MADIKINVAIDAAQAQAALSNVAKSAQDLASVLSGNLKLPSIDTNGAKQGFSDTAESAKQAKESIEASILAANNWSRDVNGKVRNANGTFVSLEEQLKAGLEPALKSTGKAAKDVGDGLEAAGESGKSLGAKALAFNNIREGVLNVSNALNDVVKVGAEFDDSLKAVGAVTGASAETLADLGNRGRELAKAFGGAATDQLKSFQGILSKFGSNVANAPEALAKMAENVNLLAKAGGIDANQAMNALTDTMLQFGLVTGDSAKDAEESTKIIDALASSAQIGAAEIPEVSASILQVGVAAKGANLSVNQTVGALQVLAVGGKKGAEAGVALRNVLSLIQKASGESEKAMQKLGTSSAELGKILTTQGLEAAVLKIKGGMDKLGTAAEKNTALMTIFGAENAAAAGILLDNSAKLGEFTNGINAAVVAGASGASGAVQQANINMQSAGAVISRIKARVEDTFIGITQAVGSSVTGAIGAINQLAPTLTGIAGIKSVIPEGAFDAITAKAKEAGAKSSEVLKSAFDKVPLDGLKDKLGSTLSKLPIDTTKFSAQFAKLGESAGGLLSKGLSGIGAAAFNPVTLGIAAAAGALTLFFTQTEAGKKSFEQIKKVASEAFGTLTKALEPLGKVFGELFGSIATSGGGLLTALSPLLEFLGKALAKQAEILGAVLVTVFTGAAKAITFISTGITAVIGGFQSFFTAISPVTTQIGLLVGEVGKFIAAFYTGAFNNIVAVFSLIGGAVVSVASAIGKFIGEAIKPLTDGFSAIGSAIGGFISSLFGTSEATKQASTNTAAIGTAADGAAKSVSTFQSVIKFLTSSITNVRAALAGISGVLSTVGAAFSQFLEGVKTLDLGKITGAFTDLGGKVQASFTSKWNETWNEANKTTEAATDKVKKDVDTKTKEAAAQAKENLSQPIELKLDIKKLAEDFDALQSRLKSVAETGVKGLTQNTLQIGETKDKVKALNDQLAKETNAQNKEALKAQLDEQKKQLAQRAAFEAAERKKAQDASKEAFKNETALTNEKNRTDRASVLKVAKDRKSAALSILAQELEANRIVETDERKRKETELADKFRIEKEKLQAELQFGDQSAAARANVNKQLIEKEKQFLNDKRKLQIEFLRQDIETSLKTADLQQKSDIAALQTRLQRVIELDVDGAERRAKINEELAQKQNEIETKALLEGIPQFKALLDKKNKEVSVSYRDNLAGALAEISKFNAESTKAFAGTTIDANGFTVDIPQADRLANVQKLLGTDEATAKLAIQNFDALQQRLTRETAAKARDNQREIEAARIQTSLDFAQREFDLRTLELERQRDKELAIAGSNSALIAQAEQKFALASLEAQGNFRIQNAGSIAAREQTARLNELQKAFATEIGAFEQNERLKTEKQAQAEAIRRQLAAGGLTPERQAAAKAELDILDNEIASFRQNEALKLDIQREFALKSVALAQQQMKERAGVIRLGADQERSIYDTLFAGLSSIADSFNASRNDFESQKANLRKQKEEELRVSGATGKERLEIIKRFKEQEREIDRKFTGGAAALAQLKDSTANVLSEFAAKNQEAFRKATINVKSFSEIGEDAFISLGVTAAATMAKVAIQGGDVGKAVVSSAFDVLQALVPIFVAQIFGISTGTAGLAGVPIAAALSATLQALVSVARAALGFRKGGYTGDGNPDQEAGVVHKGEWVSTYETTKKERSILEFLHKGGSSHEYFERVYLPEALKKQGVSVSLQTIIAKPQYAPERLQMGATSNDIARAIAQQTQALDVRLASVESAMNQTARQFQHRSEMTANVQFDNNRYFNDLKIKQKRSVLG